MLKAPEHIADYRLVRRLGRGGMAEVHLATRSGPEVFQKTFAVKQMLVATAKDQKLAAMFLDEARLAARFNHPSIVQIFDLGRDEVRYFVAMEYGHGVRPRSKSGQPARRGRGSGRELSCPDCRQDREPRL